MSQSTEEIAAAQVKCSTPQSRKWRIFMAALWWGIALLNTDTALTLHRHNHHYGWRSWLILFLGWLCACVYTWQVFRPRTCAQPEPEVQEGR